jgi:hypothetical protein
MYLQHIEGLCQFRLSTADHAPVIIKYNLNIIHFFVEVYKYNSGSSFLLLIAQCSWPYIRYGIVSILLYAFRNICQLPLFCDGNREFEVALNALMTSGTCL